MEARAALSRPGLSNLTANQSPVKMDIASVPQVSGAPPTSIPSGCLSIELIRCSLNPFACLKDLTPS